MKHVYHDIIVTFENGNKDIVKFFEDRIKKFFEGNNVQIFKEFIKEYDCFLRITIRNIPDYDISDMICRYMKDVTHEISEKGFRVKDLKYTTKVTEEEKRFHVLVESRQ